MNSKDTEKPDRTNSSNFASEAFSGLGLNSRTMEAVKRIAFTDPTEIQLRFIPPALTGKDCVGRAKTGTGKTAAFLLPIFEQFFNRNDIRALILAPTRELIEQISSVSRKLAGKGPPRTLAVYGGKKIGPQIEALKRKPEIVAATPGRLLDLSERRSISLSDFSIVVLDEVDRMFDMGFRDDISAILKKCHRRQQTMFLSATLPEDIMRLARRFLKDPITITTVAESDPSVSSLDQRYFAVSPHRKLSLLLKILEREKPILALIFTRTKRGAERLGKHLKQRCFNSAYIHGGLSQQERDRAIADFRANKVSILVATDVMGRGIDVPGISHVINYDIPENPDDYLHRVGRSARMDAHGKALTFVMPEQGDCLTAIEVLINRLIDEDWIGGFDSLGTSCVSNDGSQVHRKDWNQPSDGSIRLPGRVCNDFR